MKSDEIVFDDITKDYFEVADELCELLYKTADEIQSYHDTTGIKVVTGKLFLKAIKHYNAIIVLGKNGFGEDALALVRILIELYILMIFFADDSKEAINEQRALSYAKKDFDERKKYFTAQHSLLDEETRKIIISELDDKKQRFCDEFNVINDLAKKVCEIAEKAKLTDLYKREYSWLSAIVHSSPTGINFYHREDTGSFAYWQNDNNVRTAIMYASRYLIDVALLFQGKFGLIKTWELKKIVSKMNEITVRNNLQIAEQHRNVFL